MKLLLAFLSAAWALILLAIYLGAPAVFGWSDWSAVWYAFGWAAVGGIGLLPFFVYSELDKAPR